LFTPDQIKLARPTADCTFCDMTVLLRRPEPAPEAAPPTWPKGFEVTETPAPKPTTEHALARIDSDPYREAASPPPALRPGLSISWTDDNFYMRIGLGFFTFAFGGTTIAMWILMILGIGIGIEKLGVMIIWTILSIATGWLTRMVWRNARWVRADHKGLHWTRVAMSTRVVHAHLPDSEIAQLFVRDETPEVNSYRGQIAIPAFILYARDHHGHDHVITQVEDPEQAWWLEERLEHHLGITDRPVAGEHRRQRLISAPPARP
jgi:hypothetical protein